MQNYMPKSP